MGSNGFGLLVPILAQEIPEISEIGVLWIVNRPCFDPMISYVAYLSAFEVVWNVLDRPDIWYHCQSDTGRSLTWSQVRVWLAARSQS